MTTEEVMLKAQELADAICQSELYQKSREAERAAYADKATVRAVSAYYGKEQAVKTLLDGLDTLDPMALAKASQEMEEAREAMNALPLVQAMLEANKACNDMINAVSQVLTGAISGGHEGGCTGSCATCGGCSTQE